MFRIPLAATSLLLLLHSASVLAAPDVSGNVVLQDPTGSPPDCAQPCFVVEKYFEVYLSGNPTAPGICPAGSNAFLYTMTHLGGSAPFPPAVTRLEVAAPSTDVTSAGFIPGSDVSPSSTTIGASMVSWDFLAPMLFSSVTTNRLFICSPLPPGGVSDTAVHVDAELGLSADGSSVGPLSSTTTTTLPPSGVDVGVDANKLVIVDKLDSASKAKVVYVAKSPAVTKGTGTDVDAIGVVMTISYMGTSATAGQFDVPPGELSGDAGWKVNKDTVAKFVNKAAPAGPTGAKVAVIKPAKLLKLVGKSLGDVPIAVKAAGGPDAGGVDVIYTVVNGEDTTRHCTHFAQDACSYKSIAADTGAKLVCKNGTAAACP